MGWLFKEQGVLYQSILNAKLTGRKKLGKKWCTSNRDDRKLENTVKQSWFKHLGELHKEWTEAGVSASRVTTLRHLQENGYQATILHTLTAQTFLSSYLLKTYVFKNEHNCFKFFVLDMDACNLRCRTSYVYHRHYFTHKLKNPIIKPHRKIS